MSAWEVGCGRGWGVEGGLLVEWLWIGGWVGGCLLD